MPVEYADRNIFERKGAATCPAFPQITVRFVSGNDVEISIDIAYPPKRNAGLPDRNENIAHDLAASLLVAQEIVAEPENVPVIEIVENPEGIIVVLAYGNKQIVKFLFLHAWHVQAFRTQK